MRPRWLEPGGTRARPDLTRHRVIGELELGVHELVFDFRAPSLNECLDRMQQFGADIIKRA